MSRRVPGSAHRAAARLHFGRWRELCQRTARGAVSFLLPLTVHKTGVCAPGLSGDLGMLVYLCILSSARSSAVAGRDHSGKRTKTHHQDPCRPEDFSELLTAHRVL